MCSNLYLFEVSLRRRRVWPHSLLPLLTSRRARKKKSIVKELLQVVTFMVVENNRVQRSAVINVPNGRPSLCKYTFITPLPAVIAFLYYYYSILSAPHRTTSRRLLHSAVHVCSHTIYSILFQMIQIH